MSYELKIKAKSLAAEARIIRAEEFKLKKAANPKRYATRFLSKPREDWTEEDRKVYKRLKAQAMAESRATLWTERKKSIYESLRQHRTGVGPAHPSGLPALRWIARDTHLARMFIKGTKYLAAEQKVRENGAPDYEAVARMVDQYGLHSVPSQIMELPSDQRKRAVLELVKEWAGAETE